MTGENMDALIRRAEDLELDAKLAQAALDAAGPETRDARAQEFVAAMQRLRQVENVIERALRNGRD